MKPNVLRWSTTRLSAIALTVGGFSAAIAVRTGPTWPDLGSSLRAGLIQDRPECPVHLPKTHTIPLKLSVPGIITEVPEFHDCQRFIDATGTKFDSLYAIYAMLQLQLLPQKLDSVAKEYASGRTQFTPGDDPLAVAGAEILSYGGTYKPLGIKPDFNCLYVYRRSSQWQAKMVWVKKDEKRCAKNVNPDVVQGETLSVRQRLLAPGFGDQDFPPVARWDWDPLNKQHYIGMKCGPAWCEIGQRGFRHAVGYLGRGDVKQRRVKEIGGWYDEQFLAFKRPDGKVVPGALKATVFPASNLEDHQEPHQSSSFHTRWVLVANIALHPTRDDVTAESYKAKFNLDVTPVGQPMNALYQCYGTIPECFKGMHAGRQPTCPGNPADARWWAAIKPAKPGAIMYKCIIRRSHTGLNVPIPATARWRWLASDETTWTRCAQGCCEMH